MLAKQAWRLVNNTNPLLTSVIKARYYPESHFLNAKLGTNPSYVWRSVFEAQDVVRQGCRRKLGDGRSTKVWQIPWLPCPENGCLTTEMPEELNDITVRGLLDESQQNWDDEILRDICNNRDRELIKQVPVFFMTKGSLQLKAVIGEYVEKENVQMVLPTATALAEKRVNVNGDCSWCRMFMEDDMHVLFNCCFAIDVWNAVGLKNLITAEINDTVMSLLKRVFTIGRREQIVMVGLVCWNLWNRRNSWVWNRVSTSVFGVKAKAYNMLADWTKAREEMSKNMGQVGNNNGRWSKPASGWVKINSDAACLPGVNQVGVGCVVRDEHGHFLRARSNVIRGRFQPREAEAVGMREALSWVKNWRYSKCVFESDSKLLVDAVNGEGGVSYFHMIVDECRDIIKHFDEVLVIFSHRSANMVAHLLARNAYSSSGLQEWLSTAPDFIDCIVTSEKI